MWKHHPDNSSAEAWDDLLQTLSQLVPVAQDSGVVLGVEPESGNVIHSAALARALLDEIRSPSLQIVFDPANLFHTRPEERLMRKILCEAMDLLGPDIVLVHAKDITEDKGKQRQAAGTGRLDFDLIFSLLGEQHFDGPVIMHNLDDMEVDSSIRFLREVASRWNLQIT
jgi:sugar phosphate isomerase/epimerase